MPQQIAPSCVITVHEGFAITVFLDPVIERSGPVATVHLDEGRPVCKVVSAADDKAARVPSDCSTIERIGQGEALASVDAVLLHQPTLHVATIAERRQSAWIGHGERAAFDVGLHLGAPVGRGGAALGEAGNRAAERIEEGEAGGAGMRLRLLKRLALGGFRRKRFAVVGRD